MNKYIQQVLQTIFPFYPFWVWFVYTFPKQNLEKIIGVFWIFIAFYLFATKSNRIPKYLYFFIGFTIYNLLSVYFNDIKPSTSNWLIYIISDSNVIASALFFIIENTHFEDKFIRTMNRNIFIVVVLSLIVSFIQIRNPLFFLNLKLITDDNMIYFNQNRVFSIYSWIGLNSLGVTFPIMISILLNVYDTKSKSFSIIVISGIIVSFLSRARYVMISTIVVFLQLFINTKITVQRKVFFSIVLIIFVITFIKVSDNYGFNINQVIEERILEKEGDMGSAKARILSYYVFMIKFPEHPWLGVGPQTKDDVVQLLGGHAPIIHVGYLSYLYYYGIIGAMLLFIALFLLIRMAWIIGRRQNFWGSYYGLISFCLANLTFVYFMLDEMGIILAVIYIRYYFDKLPSIEPEDKYISESELYLNP